ncbi:MAG: protease pro-enzyme activation domain-containing protein [Ktedonobacteraceae bacterium]
MHAQFHQRSPWRWAILILAAITLVVPAILFQTGSVQAASASSARSTVPGHLVPALKHHAPIHTATANRQLQLSISLNLRNRANLDALLNDQNDPHSSLYHHYITPQQFTERFAPTAATVQSVVDYLRNEGLYVSLVASNRLLIDASGPISTVQQAFGVTIADYSLNGRTVYAPTSEPSVPANLAGVLLNIGGLDDVAVYKPMAPRIAAAGPNGGYTPTDLRTAYDMNSLISSSNGSGQTVAIFELDGYTPSDINTYLSHYGLGSAKYSNVLVDGATNTAGAGAIEVELDMEIISAIAPGATQKVYIGPNSNSGVNDTYNKIVTDNVAKVTSTSWGECESASGNSELTAMDNIFAQGAAQGQSFFAASGDSGAYDCNDNNLAVDSPAGDPHVVGVGGTNLRINSNSSYNSESAWSNPNDTQRSANGAGGGGGYSSFFSKPSYQSGPGVDSNSKRHVPDVSADADPASGYSVYCTASAAQCPSAGWVTIGGTSAAAPLWAGMAADTNAYLVSQGKHTLGNVDTELYTLFNTSQPFSAYHDVTTGNNLHYNAGTGYDLASGIGTPDAWNFARDVAGTTSTSNDFSLSANPTSLSIAQGSNATATMSTTVISGSAAAVSLTASVSPAGPTVSLNPTSVTAGGSATLTVSVGSSVAAGTYTVTVTGTEGSATHTASVAITVTSSGGGGGTAITNGGFETGNFSGWTVTGTTSISNTGHTGSHSAQVGGTSPTNGDSSISQTFTAPSGSGTLSFWYQVNCPDSVQYDWATATLKDNTTGTTSTILPNICNNNATWVRVSANVKAGDSYTLTLTSHDDNYAGDPTYTLFDDVALSGPVINPVSNPGFETGNFSGWAVAGTTSISNTGHTGSHAAQAGGTSPTNGDSSIRQTFTASSGSSMLSFWYQVNCPDSVQYDWATATLKDNTTGTTTTILSNTCNNDNVWMQVSANVKAGDSYTLTLTSHDDNYAGDPTYTLFDDVAVN